MPSTLFGPASTRSDGNKTLVSGGLPACMGAPNHSVRPCSSWNAPFPLLHVCVEGDERPRPLFYDARYGEPYHDYEMTDVPPTWMDPMAFAAMARENPEVLATLDAQLAKNEAKTPSRLLAALDSVLTEAYIPYLVDRFEQAKPLLAEWLLVNHAARSCDAQLREETLKEQARSRRRKRVRVEDREEPPAPAEGEDENGDAADEHDEEQSVSSSPEEAVN